MCERLEGGAGAVYLPRVDVTAAKAQHERLTLVRIVLDYEYASRTVGSAPSQRADGVDDWPAPGMSAELTRLRERFPHFRVFSGYIDGIDPFLARSDKMPTCSAGARSFNVDHVGNVSPCIEKIDRPVGNLRTERLSALLPKLKAMEEIKTCQQCWTLCRGVNQAFAGGGSFATWRELATRVRA